MSFLTTSSSSPNGNKNFPTRCEEMRTLFNSLNHDIFIRQQSFDPPTPPLTPESPLHAMQTNHLTSLNNCAREPAFLPRYARSTSHSSQTPNINEPSRSTHAQYTTPMHTEGYCKCCTTTRNEFPPESTHRDLYRRQYLPVPSPSPSHSYKHFQGVDSTHLASDYTLFQPSLNTTSLNPSSLKRKHWQVTRDEYQQPSSKQPKIVDGDDDRRKPLVTPTLTHGHKDEERNNRNEERDDRNACQIQGLLSLPGSREPKFNISKTELERRVNEPECLTKVDMISYVRLAKNTARNLLDGNEIKTNQHNKRSEHTILSRMCESECQVLAQGVSDINFKYFPGSWFAKKSVQEILMIDDATEEAFTSRQIRKLLRDRIEQDEKTKWILLDICKGLEQRANDGEMKKFNLMSHTFGVPNLINHTYFLFHVLEEELRVLKSYL